MPSIGQVVRQEDGSLKGYLATLSINKNIQFVPNEVKKKSDHLPDFHIMAGNIEVGAAWKKNGSQSGKEYISVSLAAPEFGDRTIYANLGQEAGQDDEDVMAIIWSPKS